MKLMDGIKPISFFDIIKETADKYNNDPVRAYGDELFDEYVDKNLPKLKEWMERRDVLCLTCESQRRKCDENDLFLGCETCWNNECEMLELADKFHAMAAQDFHLLSQTTIDAMMEKDRKKREADI